MLKHKVYVGEEAKFTVRTILKRKAAALLRYAAWKCRFSFAAVAECFKGRVRLGFFVVLKKA